MIRHTLFASLLLVGLVSLRAEEGYQAKVEKRVLLKTSSDAAGRAIQYPSSGTPEVSCLEVTVPVGETTGWHMHPMPCVGYLLAGELTLEADGLPSRVYKQGDVIAEVVNLRHRGTNTGRVPAVVFLVVIGEQGVPASKLVPAPAEKK
jgi:quercetin dioxygenase-like cupin family protein